MPLFKRPIEQALIKMYATAGKPITKLQFYALELEAWKHSPERKEMLDGERYYMGEHDILNRQRKAIGPDGTPITITNLPNNRIVDNQYAKHVDQKNNYLLGKPISFNSENKEYAQKVKEVLAKRFMRAIKNAGVDILNCGIAWVYPYYNKNNKLDFRFFPGFEILPFWKDAAHTECESALRLYPVEVYEGVDKKIIEKVDIFELDGISTYIFENGVLIPDLDCPKQSYVTIDGKPYNWERFPLIPLKCNAKEIPLIRRGRSLQDAINLLQSDFANNMQEDVRNTILVLKNYDGQDLGEFRRNLMTYGAIKVRTVEGKDGGVESLEIKVNADNYKIVLELLKKALIENLRSYDAKDDRLSSSPNQMNIQSMYSDIDLDANSMESELQAAFEELLWFVDTYLASIGAGAFENDTIEVIFNRDILINETEAIKNCSKSAGIISDDTIIAMHPWVNDPVAERERIDKQNEETDPYRAAFEQAKQQMPKGGVVDEE